MTDRTPPNLAPPVPGERQVETPEEGDDLLSRIRKRYDDGTGAFEENRRLHSEDLNFIYNTESMGQWDPVVLTARAGKPSYTFNRVIGPVNIVVADMRQTCPSGKVRPNADGADQQTADILAGLCRSIEDMSRASVIYKEQYKFAVAGGFGAWYIAPQYAGPNTFDQVLRLHGLANPQTAVWDPECNDACAGDAMWAMIGSRISKEKHKTLYPNASYSSFQMSRDAYGWFTDKEVRVVDYYERVAFEKTIAKLSDGTVKDLTPELQAADDHFESLGMGEDKATRIVDRRKVLKWRVMWCKTNGGEILEGPIYYDWKRIPVIRCPGRYINIEGRRKLQSLVRHAKDAQRSYNSRVSDMIERSALTPKAPYLVTETMVKGYENLWAQANTASRPYLPYNVDKTAEGAGGMPLRTPPLDMPQGALALAQAAAADVQATTGFFDPALGNAEDMNRVSGKALVQHTRRSDLGSFEFIDGFNDALQLTWEMLIDMIPTVYDANRVEMIIGPDEIEKEVELYAESDSGDIINDLKKGSYNCKVTLGPSYQTARQETLDTLISAAEVIPSMQTVAPDLIASNIDSPIADELARRLRIPLIQQGIVQPTDQEKKNLPPPAPPDPLHAAEIARAQALADRDQATAVIEKARAALAPEETHKQVVEIAGKHLANMLMAQKLGLNVSKDTREAEAAAAQGQSAP